jgi:DUF1680 family protein
MKRGRITRREFVGCGAILAAGMAVPRSWSNGAAGEAEERAPLQELGYGDVTVTSELHRRQLEETLTVLMGLSEDSLLKPMREMGGQTAPGKELGGWYSYDAKYDEHPQDTGFAPAANFGQWVSALAREYAIKGDAKLREKVLRLNRLYAKTITGDFYENNRFPAYCYDKLVCGLMDAHQLAGDPDAWRILEETTKAALPHLPGKAIEHGRQWRPGKPDFYTWDESYTMPENLFLAYQRGAGEQYRALGAEYLDDEYFDPLTRSESNLAGRHAYSHVNALCSAMQAYLTLGNAKYLGAAKNGFDFLAAQSYATGGWGPNETLQAPDSDDLYASLTKSHNSFETPCGAYAHFKLTRYLLRVTRDARYGDSMERVMYNTVLGAKPLQEDGRTFYYSDYNFKARKVYKDARWPCCAGTLPQVAADYGINAYLRDALGVYVNLYVPSTVRWVQDGARVSLKQMSAYPLESEIAMEVTSSRKKEFTVNLRIPLWAEGARAAVNGKRVAEVVPGSFVAVRREWKTGDRIELELPLKKRLEAIDARHGNTVALMSGPLVLFAIGEAIPEMTREELLAAKMVEKGKWRVETTGGKVRMLPFTGITDEAYSGYVVMRS